MDEPTFWKVIETAVYTADGNTSGAERALLRDLTKRSPADVQRFQQILQSLLDDAYTWDLWGAAYLINGGCSDDGFEYFRCWLISRGRLVYESALANADSLADAVSPEDDEDGKEFESLLYVGTRAYEKLTGSKMLRHPHAHLREPKGRNWDFDDAAECAKRLPRLLSIGR